MTIQAPTEHRLRRALIPLPVLITSICTSFVLTSFFVIFAWVSGYQAGGSIWPWAGYALSVSMIELVSFGIIASRVAKHYRAWNKQERRMRQQCHQAVHAPPQVSTTQAPQLAG